MTAWLGFSALTGWGAENPAMSSPFLPSGGQAAPGPVTENTPLELRGIINAGNGTYIYGLFDPAKRQAAWVKLNDSDHPFVVRSHDTGTDTITVDYQGRVLTLALKQPKIESMAAMPMPPPMPGQPPPMPGQPPRGPQPVALNPTPADEAKRLESVAAEVRRRRALRQAAAQQQQGAVPQQPMQPQPMQPAPR